MITYPSRTPVYTHLCLYSLLLTSTVPIPLLVRTHKPRTLRVVVLTLLAHTCPDQPTHPLPCLPGNISEKTVVYLLQKKLRALYQNRYTAPQLRHAVVETDLRLEELCALNLAWEIDGDQLVCDWSAEDSYGRLAALTDIFGERYVCFYFMYQYCFCLFICSIF